MLGGGAPGPRGARPAGGGGAPPGPRGAKPKKRKTLILQTINYSVKILFLVDISPFLDAGVSI